jgi:branched-chain amino acid transport system substrate-binding protein
MLGREAGGPMGRRGLGVRGLTTVGRRAVPALLGGALLAACTGGGPGDLETPSLNPISALTSPSTPAKVALLVPLSSQGAPGVIARNLKQAAELALFERDSRVVELIVKDDKGTPEGAKAAADDALKRGATLILGPLYAKSVAAVAPAARKAGVPVVAVSTDRQVAGNGVYLMSFQPAPEVERVIAFAAKRGKLRYAALIPGDGFGKLVEPVFRNAVTQAGGTIVALETYPANANALLAPLRKISAEIAAAEAAGAPIDALFMPGGQEYLELLGRLLPMAKIDVRKVKVIGTGGMDYPNAGRDAALVGAWYPGPDPAGWSEFAQKYAKTYQAAPPRIAGFAHDAVSMAIVLAGDASRKGFSAPALTRASGFAGIDGAYRLRLDGTTDRALAILEVQKFGPTVIEPAPNLSAPSPSTTAASEKGFSLLKAFQ